MSDLTPLYKRLTELLERKVPECWDEVKSYDSTVPYLDDRERLVETNDGVSRNRSLYPDLAQLKVLIEAEGWWQYSGHVCGEGFFCTAQNRLKPHNEWVECGDSELEAVLKAAIKVLEANP